MRERDAKPWGLHGREAQAEADVAQFLDNCRLSLKWFYIHVLKEGNRKFQTNLGRLHDYLFDFLRWDELRADYVDEAKRAVLGVPELPDWARNTDLYKYIPEHGKERWLYWPTLDEEPEVYDGRGHRFEKAWLDGELIKGLVVRFAGSGRIKGCYLPRLHLKSQIATFALSCQEIVRDPSVRIMVRSYVARLSKALIGEVKGLFEREDGVFASVFGELRPENKEDMWSTSAIRLRAPFRRGKEPTLEAIPLGSDATGNHAELIILDDVVGELNVNQQDDVKLAVGQMAFVMTAGGTLLDIGTRWADDDAHGLFLRPSKDGGGPDLYGMTSFIWATARDAKDQPMWPEYFTEEVLAEKRGLCADEYTWFCQFFNNPYIARAQSFSPTWWRTYPETPDEKLARLVESGKKVNIFLSVDPAGSKTKKSDYTAMVMQGQTDDGEEVCVLDGAWEKLGPEEVPERIADLVVRGLGLARRGQGFFRLGLEKSSLTTWLGPLVRAALAKRGIVVDIEEISHGNKPKLQRIWRLAPRYNTGGVLWPAHLAKATANGTYDFTEVARQQYIKFPHGGDDILDAEAMQEDMLKRVSVAAVARTPEPQKYRDTYVRAPPSERREGPGRYAPNVRASVAARIDRAGLTAQPGRYVPRR